MNVTIVIGTARRGRQSEKVGKLLKRAFAQAESVTSELVDVRDHVTIPETIPSWGEEIVDPTASEPGTAMYTSWKEIVARSDAFVFILPEYNHGYPGEWKLLIDALGKAYEGKAAYLVGVSGGSFSGVRVADHVKPVLVELGFQVQKTGLYIGNVQDALTADGEATDDALQERVVKFVDAVAAAA